MIASLNNFRGSPRKFVKYLRAIKNENAINIAERLKFMPGEYAQAVRSLIISAVANATSDSKVNPSNLVVFEASVGRGPFLKRVCFRGRGRVGRVTKFSSNLRVVLKQGESSGK